MKRLWLILPLLFVFSCKNSIKNDITHNIKYQLSGFSIEETQKSNQDFIRELKERAEKQTKAEQLKREQFRQKIIRMVPLFLLIIALILLLLRWKYGLPILLQKRVKKLYKTFNKLIVFMGIKNKGWQRITSAGLIFFLILPIAHWNGYEIPFFVYLSDFIEGLIPSIGFNDMPDGPIWDNIDEWRRSGEINFLGKLFFILYHLTFYILGIKLFTWIKSGFSK